MKNIQTILQQTNELKIFAENRARLLLEAQGILYSVKTVGYNFYKDKIFFHFEENVYNNDPSGILSEIEITAEQLAMNDKDFESLLKKQNMKQITVELNISSSIDENQLKQTLRASLGQLISLNYPESLSIVEVINVYINPVQESNVIHLKVNDTVRIGNHWVEITQINNGLVCYVLDGIEMESPILSITNVNYFYEVGDKKIVVQ